MEFVGRERDLGLLRKRLDKVREGGRGSFIAMRGRRRVGKSRLAEEFARVSGCPCVYYTAVQQSGEAELGRTGRVLLRPSGTEPLVRVMVEAPDLAGAQRHAEAIAAVVIDRLSLSR